MGAVVSLHAHPHMLHHLSSTGSYGCSCITACPPSHVASSVKYRGTGLFCFTYSSSIPFKLSLYCILCSSKSLDVIFSLQLFVVCYFVCCGVLDVCSYRVGRMLGRISCKPYSIQCSLFILSWWSPKFDLDWTRSAPEAQSYSPPNMHYFKPMSFPTCNLPTSLSVTVNPCVPLYGVQLPLSHRWYK